MLLSIPPRPSSRARLISGLSLRAGDVLAGRYRALSLLRADRACAHLAALEIATNRRVEVQVLLTPDDDAEPAKLRFLADARKAAGLESAHALRVLHVGVSDDGHPFVVREPASGQTVAALLARMGSLPTEHAVDVAIAVCEALEGAHALGIVHADLDPTMVRLDWTSDGPSNVKVSGLGTSRALLVADGELDARVDVWGIGVLLYTMLAGASPFGGDTPSTSDVSTAGDEPALLAGVPDGLAEIVDACLARHPARRPQSASSVAALLAVFGTRPIFEKRSSLLVVDTGPYEALVLEELVKEAAPSTRQLAETAATPPSPDKTPVPVVVTRSVPPVAVTLAPPPPSPARQWRTTALVAAACIGLGVFAGAFAMHRASSTPSSSVSAAAVHTPPPPAAEPLPEPVAKAAMPASPAVQPATLSVSDLPAMPTSKARPRSPAAKSGVAPAAPVDPIVHSASAPMQPQPKADDDLRRFLDDRR